MMAQSPTSSHQAVGDELPLRRFWWLKRLCVGAAAGGVLFALAWIAWDQYSRHEGNRRLKAYAAAGEPAAIKEYRPVELPESRNAAPVYVRAANAVTSTVESPSISAEQFDGRLPYQPQWMEMARKAIEANGQAIGLARDARTRPDADWGIQIASPPMLTRQPWLASQRRLANLMADGALYEHFAGDDARAFADARGILHQGRALEQSPFVVSWLVGHGIQAMAFDRLEIMAGGLTIADADAHAVRPAETHTLIAELLDDSHSRQDLTTAIKWERVYVTEDVPAILAQGWIIQPAGRLDQAWLMDRWTACAAAIQHDSYPAAKASIPVKPALSEAVNAQNAGGVPFAISAKRATPPTSPPSARTPSPSASMIPSAPTATDGCVTAHGVLQFESTDWIVTRFYQDLCERRMLAVILAYRLYVLDHGGQWPADLSQLVPAYLPAMPGDPYAADGRPFGYFLVEGGQRPILYSVGEDGVDNTKGKAPNLEPRLLAGWQLTRDGPDDQYRDLTAWVSPESRKPFVPWAQSEMATDSGLEPGISGPVATQPSGESEHHAEHTDAPGKNDKAQQQGGKTQ